MSRGKVKQNFTEQLRKGEKVKQNHEAKQLQKVKQFCKKSVPRAGFEPARTEVQRILSPSRLPIPPPRLLQAYR